MKINNNGSATIKSLENSECLALIEAIHGKTNFDKKLFCNGVIPLTPEKPPEPESSKKGEAAEPPLPNTAAICPDGKPLPPYYSPSDTAAIGPDGKPLPPHNSPSASASNGIPPPMTKITPAGPTNPGDSVNMFNMIQEQFSNSIPEFPRFSSREDLVRRHSLSSMNRSPPPDSLIADILCLNRPSLTLKESSRSIMSNISQIQESLSDFNSCLESSSSDEEASVLEEESVLKTANEKKREKKKKRKLKLTPGKEQFLKKQNTQISPTK